MHYSTCISKGSCIVTLSQRISSSTTKEISRLVILVWVDSWVHRLSKLFLEWEHHFTWVPRSCKAKVMTGNQMSGVWAALAMSYVHWEVLLGKATRKISICMSCFRGYLKEVSHHLRSDTVRNCVVWLLGCWKWTLIKDLILIRSVNSAKRTKNTWPTSPKLIHI